MFARCLFLLLTGGALASSATAQLVVRVESQGTAVYGAEVAVWSDSGRVAAGRTDGAGVIRFPGIKARGAVAFVTARRVGFSPARLSAPAADSVVLFLSPRSNQLAAVAVISRTLQCPAEADDSALTLWRQAAARYAAGQDTMPWAYSASVAEETVAEAARGFGEAAEQQKWSGQLTPGKGSAIGSYGMTGAFTYGIYQPPFGAAYGKWTYPVMYGSAAGVFTSDYFGAHHTFVVLGRAADLTTLGFCARSRTEPELEGELEIAGDTAVISARWQFRVPHHDEHAGGEAIFADSRLDGARYLVAVSTTSWRRVRRALYDQERIELDAWKFGHTTRETTLDSWQTRGDRSGTP